MLQIFATTPSEREALLVLFFKRQEDYLKEGEKKPVFDKGARSEAPGSYKSFCLPCRTRLIYLEAPLFSFIDSFCTGKRCVCHLCRSFLGSPFGDTQAHRETILVFPFMLSISIGACARDLLVLCFCELSFSYLARQIQESSASPRALYIWNKSVERSQNGWLRAGWGGGFYMPGLHILMNINISILEVLPPVLLSLAIVKLDGIDEAGT